MKKEKTKNQKIDYKKHWRGMPEFNQETVKPEKKLIVCFKTSEDILRFSKLIGQMITAKTRSIYFPAQEIDRLMDKRWSDSKSKRK